MIDHLSEARLCVRYAANQDIGNLRLGDPLGCGLVLIVRSARRFTARTLVLQLPEPCSWRSAMTDLGHGLPPPIPVGGSAMVRSADLLGTFRGGGRAPIPDLPTLATERGGSSGFTHQRSEVEDNARSRNFRALLALR